MAILRVDLDEVTHYEQMLRHSSSYSEVRKLLKECREEITSRRRQTAALKTSLENECKYTNEIAAELETLKARIKIVEND